MRTLAGVSNAAWLVAAPGIHRLRAHVPLPLKVGPDNPRLPPHEPKVHLRNQEGPRRSPARDKARLSHRARRGAMYAEFPWPTLGRRSGLPPTDEVGEQPGHEHRCAEHNHDHAAPAPRPRLPRCIPQIPGLASGWGSAGVARVAPATVPRTTRPGIKEPCARFVGPGSAWPPCRPMPCSLARMAG